MTFPNVRASSTSCSGTWIQFGVLIVPASTFYLVLIKIRKPVKFRKPGSISDMILVIKLILAPKISAQDIRHN